MRFDICHVAFLLKYTTWLQKELKNMHFYYFTFGLHISTSQNESHVKQKIITNWKQKRDRWAEREKQLYNVMGF